ncbi:MAG: protein translocase subunit SecD [Planctomycetales bacterium]|nr:protein translocase subunit SecD [Planctomycetales bacterium]
MSNLVPLLIVAAVMIVPFVVGAFFARRLRMPDYGWRIGLVLFSILAGATIIGFSRGPRLGIDLSGGSILVYQIDPAEVEADQQVAERREGEGDEEKPEATAGQHAPIDMGEMIAALSRRVNPGGQKEVIIREYGVNQIEIIIPEADDAETALIEKKISSIGTLEFRIVANSRDHGELIEAAQQTKGHRVKTPRLEGLWVPVDTSQTDHLVQSISSYEPRSLRTNAQGNPEVLMVLDQYNVNGGYLTNARAELMDVRPKVGFSFNNDGAVRFRRLTSENLPDEAQGFYRLLGVVLDGYLYSAPRINSPISDRGVIEGDFSREQVDQFVAVLNAGRLPTRLQEEPISKLVMGPTLGADTIAKGKWAIAFSVVVTVLFMIVYYRFAGLVAALAVMTNLLLTMAVVILVKASLTLAGLAGLALTLGMSVDANVLIYERIREELNAGGSLRMAIRNGFGRAMSAIVDANVTTLITAVVLYVIGTDQIKGFAITLFLGIVFSMYTAIFCARVVFDVAERSGWIKKLTMMSIVGSTNIDFVGRFRPAFAASLIFIVVGLVAVGMRGQGILDIDFTGGTTVHVQFVEPQQIADVRASLSADAEEFPDLQVNSVDIEDVTAGTYFIVTTSNPDISNVEAALEKVFAGKLITNSLEPPTLTDIGPAAQADAAPDATTPSTDADDDNAQSRSEVSDDNLLALADIGTQLAFLQEGDGTSATADDAPDGDSAAPETAAPEAPPAEDAASESAAAEPATETPAADTPAADPDAGEQEADAADTESAEVERADTAAADEEPSENAPVGAFVGGTQAELVFAEEVSHGTVADYLTEIFPDIDVEVTSEEVEPGSSTPRHEWTAKIAAPRDEVAAGLAKLSEQLKTTTHFPASSQIGGAVAGHTQLQAIYAIFTSLVLIGAYVWIRFQNFVFSVAAVTALAHDVLVTLGAIALSAFVAQYLGFIMIDPVKINLAIVAAFLTIIGYSLNDTIVVFDRLREVRGKSPVITADMINTSMNQVLSRTLLTSFTTLLVVFVLYVAGGQGIHDFAFCLLVGVVAGTYSSIFIASPILLWMIRQPSGNSAQRNGAQTKAVEAKV